MTSPATPLANMFGWGVKVPILRALESVILASEDLRSGVVGTDAAGTGNPRGIGMKFGCWGAVVKYWRNCGPWVNAGIC